MKQKQFILLWFLLGLLTVSAQNTVNGNVTDATNIPLPGVNVVIKGGAKGVTTDFDGNYSIEASASDVLEFSYVGFISQSVSVGNNSTINIVLQEDVAQLDEVVVIGYGTSNKKTLVSAVSSVKSDVLENQPVARVDQALQGRAAGVEVTSNSGAPGTGSTIRIRGNSSINGNNNPLFVVDGFITGTGFNLNNISVNDIESVEILKDATALAIYGTRGASGVIIITTKTGKRMVSGKPTIRVNSSVTTEMLANKINILGGQDYVDYLNEAGQFVAGPDIDYNGTLLPIGFTDPSLPLRYDDPGAVPVTDWIDEVVQMGTIYNTDVSITGNTENSNYYSSISYFNQEGIVKGSGLERVTLRNNLDARVSDRFNIGLRLNLSSFKKENNKTNFSQIVNNVLPIRTIYDANGNFTGTNPLSGTLQRNPVADILLREDHDLVTNIISNAYFEYKLLEGLKIKTNIGATLNFYKNNEYLPSLLPERILNNNVGGYGRVRTSQSKDLLSETTINYSKEFGDHSLSVLGGFSGQKITSESTDTSAEGFPNDVVKFNNLSLGSDPETYQVGSGYNQRTLTSLFGRLTYSYDDRYVLTLVGRRDGSSVFEAGNKYAFFPSAGIAWNIDEESFMENVDVINRLKLRGSYGEVGEQGVKTYNSFDLFNPVYTYFNENLVPGVILDAPGSTNLQWETTEQLDLGLEIGLLNNRISFEVGYYDKTTKDLLLFRDLPNTAGSRVLENVGSVQNRGFEFLLNTVNIDKNDFSWSSTLTLSTNKSKVLDLGQEEFINIQSTGNQGGPSARLMVGQPMPVFYVAEYLGTYKDPQEIIDDQTIGKSFLGSPRYRDLNNDGVINQQDYSVAGSPQPDFYGGFRNTFTYKNLSLDVFFQGSYGGEIFNMVTQTSIFGRGDQNIDPRVLNRWVEGVNETSDIPRAGTSASLFNPNSTLNVEDGSFLRLRTATLNYNVPVKKAGIDNTFKSLNVFLTGRNLWLLSDFQLGDPEVNNFTDGSGFDSVSQGFVNGAYPYATSISFGVKMEF
ncbi:TonB-dependent receptor [Tamlana fucoidanivorans]|uniref:TonB-dependent receptor n=2 Tax=Flavobacteriaceae TaxID=49546 RepID=A0A5C4SQ02_9FLAO|nr:TonB-dependent receptor [Tamlana fucoidanivorans]TNJ46006.1 TonB-dependent receptor [Tamlana fucoidanivorans]